MSRARRRRLRSAAPRITPQLPPKPPLMLLTLPPPRVRRRACTVTLKLSLLLRSLCSRCRSREPCGVSLPHFEHCGATITTVQTGSPPPPPPTLPSPSRTLSPPLLRVYLSPLVPPQTPRSTPHLRSPSRSHRSGFQAVPSLPPRLRGVERSPQKSLWRGGTDSSPPRRRRRRGGQAPAWSWLRRGHAPRMPRTLRLKAWSA
mmetsp:Transcript_16216/g.39870  ORF Transcript_16216/g.39870 Transcript_16216/m.39870 type:complete len:202 (+) Transcript_16216:4532-5137(+)